MQMAFAAIGKVLGGLGLGAASGATAGAATAAGTVTGATSGALTALQGFGAVLKVLGTMGQANAASNASLQQANEADLQASQEKLDSQQRQNRISRELARVLGQNDVTYAAAGIDLTGGIAATQAQDAKKRAAAEITIDRRDTDFRAAQYRARAAGLRDRARSERGAGLIGALGTAADFGISMMQRG